MKNTAQTLESSQSGEGSTTNTCYLAGPMRGYPDFNFPEFHRVAKELRSLGWEVYSPAERDEDDPIVQSTQSAFKTKKGESVLGLSYFMQFDLVAVCNAEAVWLLDGWEQSEGARLEVYTALALGKNVRVWSSLEHVTELPPKLDGAVLDFGPRVMSEDSTGGRKEETQARFDLVTPDALTELARVYGYGESKYPSDASGPNYLKGYAWHKSIASLFRHVLKFMFGESIDPETGLHHLAHAAWHCFTLIAFEKRGLGTDDRKKKGQ